MVKLKLEFIEHHYFESLTLISTNQGLCYLGLGKNALDDGKKYLEKYLTFCRFTETKIVSDAKKQLISYLKGSLKQFTMPLDLFGTNFRLLVWNKACSIPYGKTTSYSSLAESIKGKGSKASRAIGQALGHNPIAIVIPCHRVLGSSGALTGYYSGIENKKYLLELEQNNL